MTTVPALRPKPLIVTPSIVPDNQNQIPLKNPIPKIIRVTIVVVSPTENVEVWHGMQMMLLAGNVAEGAPTLL